MSGTANCHRVQPSLDEVIALDIWAHATYQHGGSWLALAECADQLVGVRQRFYGPLTIVLPAATLAEGRSQMDGSLDYYPAQPPAPLFALTDPSWSTRVYDGVLAQTTGATLLTMLDGLSICKDAPIYVVVRSGMGMMRRTVATRLVSQLAAAGYRVTWKAGLHTAQSLLWGGLGKLAELAGFGGGRDRTHFRMRRGFVTPGLPLYARTYLLVAVQEDRLT